MNYMFKDVADFSRGAQHPEETSKAKKKMLFKIYNLGHYIILRG